ncbi:MAG: glycosyltransferase [Flavobacteriales bacterium]|nr:glycosyltransferase [Flavobacteriales bacterium]
MMSCRHNYPGYRSEGVGKQTLDLPSGSGMHLHDLLVKGLAEEGHEVLYHLPLGTSIALPEGVRHIVSPTFDADICHIMARQHEPVAKAFLANGRPAVATNHLYVQSEVAPKHWVHVSKTIANKYKSNRYIWCGLDPQDFLYSDQKEDYLLFISNQLRFKEKGLITALEVAREHETPLVVVGSSSKREDIDEVDRLCALYGATYLGDVRGIEKAKLLAKAKALISPSELCESFGLVLVEAMFSGTPVICSEVGAYPEIVSTVVGFVCKDKAAYHIALEQLSTISSAVCRQMAMEHYHYKVMTHAYIELYRAELTSYKEIAY